MCANAALGLRRFRTLSLGPEVTLAEGYRRLAVADFTTRSSAQLVRHLGGEPALLEVREGPRVAVVVRTRDRPELLAEALGSLAEGQYRRVTVVLVNRSQAQTENVTVNFSDFVPAHQPFTVMSLSGLNGETFVSHTQNALQTSAVTPQSGSLQFSLAQGSSNR